MRNMIFSALAGAAISSALILATAPAQAQDAPPPGGGFDMFARADTNGDGAVTQAEWLADVDTRFARIDTNKDGKITEAEREAIGGGRMGGGGGGMRRADTDGDGVITLAEQRAAATERFGRIDSNSDGKIDQAERDAMPRGPGRGGPPRSE